MTPPATSLPDDPAALKDIIAGLHLRQTELQRRHDEMYVDLLRAQQELLRLRKQVYGPRADQVRTPEELAQLVLAFGQEWAAAKPDAQGVVPALVAVKPHSRRRHEHGRRDLAEANDLPTTRVVHELPPEERACPACGSERAVIGSDSSFQLEHVPARMERIEHVQMKYACAHCEAQAEPAQVERAPKPPAVIERCLAAPGLLAYIITAKFHDFLPLYRLERIFERQGFLITRGTQSAWCEQVAERLEPLYQLMAARVRASHVVATDDTPMPMQAPGKVKQTRMWVYLGDAANPYNVFDFTLGRGRDGPTAFLGDFKNTLLADGYGGYNGVVVSNAMRRAGCHAHARRKFVDAQAVAPAIAAEALGLYRALYAVEARGRGTLGRGTARAPPGPVEAACGHAAATARAMEAGTAAQAPHGRSRGLCPQPVGAAHRFPRRRRRADRQQPQRARDEARRAQSQELALCGPPRRRPRHGGPRQLHQHLLPPQDRPPALPHPTALQPAGYAARRTPPLAPRCLAPPHRLNSASLTCASRSGHHPSTLASARPLFKMRSTDRTP